MRRKPAHDQEALRRAFETGEYPYASRLSGRGYNERVPPPQAELLKAQARAKESGERCALPFEGRDVPARAAPASASWSG